MAAFRCLCAFLALCTSVAAQRESTSLPQYLVLLARIKQRMGGNLMRQPNYTCQQTIERSQRLAGSGKFQLVDTVRLEVALVGGKELFAWPGESVFQDREISEMVRGGAIGNGDFALHARALFLGDGPSFRYVGEEELDSRRVARFDYEVRLQASDYWIRAGTDRALVAYYGSFWTDLATNDLIRLDVKVDRIPEFLRLKSLADQLEYERVRIGEEDFLLPARADLVLTDSAGNIVRNRTSFSGCRQFTGQSTLSFADPPPAAAPAQTPRAKREVELPAGLDLDLALETAIDSTTAAVGDPVRAKLLSAVTKGGETLLPKGAVLSGRLLHLQRVRIPGEAFQIEWRFDFVEAPDVHGPVHVRLEEIQSLFAGLRAAGGDMRLPGSVRLIEPSRPDGGAFLARTGRLRLPRGLRMRWRTVEPVAAVAPRNP